MVLASLVRAMRKARTARDLVTLAAITCGLAAALLVVHGCGDDPGALKSDVGGEPGSAADASGEAQAASDAAGARADGPADAPSEGAPRADAGMDPSLVAFWRFEDTP